MLRQPFLDSPWSKIMLCWIKSRLQNLICELDFRFLCAVYTIQDSPFKCVGYKMQFSSAVCLQRRGIRRWNGNFVSFLEIILNIMINYPMKRRTCLCVIGQISSTRTLNLTSNFEASILVWHNKCHISSFSFKYYIAMVFLTACMRHAAVLYFTFHHIFT